jgi:chromosome segregation ATPase
VQAQIETATAELSSAERRLSEERAALRRAAKESEARADRLTALEADLRARVLVVESREAEVRDVKDHAAALAAERRVAAAEHAAATAALQDAKAQVRCDEIDAVRGVTMARTPL